MLLSILGSPPDIPPPCAAMEDVTDRLPHFKFIFPTAPNRPISLLAGVQQRCVVVKRVLFPLGEDGAPLRKWHEVVDGSGTGMLGSSCTVVHCVRDKPLASSENSSKNSVTEGPRQPRPDSLRATDNCPEWVAGWELYKNKQTTPVLLRTQKETINVEQALL